MGTSELKTVPVDGLQVVSSKRDLRRDLHIFARYVRDREVKRTHRGNLLPKGDALRLAAEMQHGDVREEIEDGRRSDWLDSIDSMALLLGFVKYDTEGEYLGYSSTGPSYPENYISFEEKRYERFLAKPLGDQEKDILGALLGRKGPSESEFFAAGPLSRLDRFDSCGCATGVLPTLSFPDIRRRLLEILGRLQAGRWYSTASLVQLLRQTDPFFLIPPTLPKSLFERERRRYYNFHEVIEKPSYERIDIAEETERAFERVEGRYVERFLEGDPLTLGYVDLAYGKPEIRDVRPSYGGLKAFRPTEILALAVQSRIAAPRVVVLPDFEVHVDSAVYPAAEISRLLPLARLEADGPHAVMKLEKARVAQAAADLGTDAVEVLRDLAADRLPSNVEEELRSWVRRSEAFTLYEGFGILETEEIPDPARPFIEARVSPGIAVVRSSGKVFAALEKAELVPERLAHGAALRRLPAGSSSLFASKERPVAAAKAKPKAVLRRSVRFSLRFPDRPFFIAFRKASLDRACVLEADERSLTVTYSKGEEPVVREVLQAIKAQRDFRIQEDPR